MHILRLMIAWSFDFDLSSFLLGSEQWSFLPEVALRTMCMFLVILFSLRLLGKRSISQLSVFELGVIIGLGSAAGDPMFYKDVGLLPGLMVFVVVISFYRFVTYLINNSSYVEKVLEGEAVYIAEGGKFKYENFQSELIAHEEFFTQLRGNNVSHLGQVKYAILETNGTVSLFYFPDEEVQWGLPVLPHLRDQALTQLPEGGKYACLSCGQIEESKTVRPEHACPVCGKHDWVKAINNRRIT
jgi:uncharacterized membrane protein YcaP (DUF421 family)